MKAIAWHDVGDIRLENVSEPSLKENTDAICGTDLHFVRGTFSGMKPGTILGHEGVGVVEEVGKGLRNVNVGDRVVIAPTIACGGGCYCRTRYYAQCDTANPNGPTAGTTFFGATKASGPFHGLQAEYARVPFAHTSLVKLPSGVSDDEALMLSDIFPTGYFGAEMASIKPGHTVAVFGCGPVDQFAIASAKLLGAGRLFAVDTLLPDRLEMTRAQGAETIDFNVENPVETLQELTGGSGPDCVIDAVGVDTNPAESGPGAKESTQHAGEFARERQTVAPDADPKGDQWVPGKAPSQALRWAVEAVAKAGTVSIIGVYPPAAEAFPIGKTMSKNLTLRMGNVHHRRYIPTLVDYVRTGRVRPTEVLTKREPLTHALEAFKTFDQRKPGWIKVELVLSA